MTPSKLAEFAVFFGACQKLSELRGLISLLRRRRLRTVVEIGTMRGGTLWLWCRLAEPDALIVSIDLPGGDFGGGYTFGDMKRFRTYAQKGQKLVFLRGDSHLAATRRELERMLKGRKIDFLMIDGDHRYSGVKRDFALYRPLVKQNGVIAFHDILPHPQVPRCRVDRLWKEIRRSYKHVELIEREDDRGWGQWGGIGVIYHFESALR